MANIYRERIGNLMKKIPVLRKEQLMLYLIKSFDVHSDIADSIIETITENGDVFLSTNDLVTTRATINYVFRKEDISIREHIFKLNKPIILNKELESQIDTFWVILKNMPQSDEFVLSNGPISAVYADVVKNRIVEIIVIPQGKEELYTNLFKYHFTYTVEAQSYYERIAILENPSKVSLVGYVGFTELYYISKDNPDGHILYFIEQREHSIAWKDVVCADEIIKEKIYEL